MRLLGKEVLAEKLWDTFRSLNYYRGTCRKTYDQLGVPLQNLWLAVAATALREVSVAGEGRVQKSRESTRRASTG